MASSAPSSVVNELALGRTRAAAERTLLAWVSSCLKLIAFGFAFDRIAAALDGSAGSGNGAVPGPIAVVVGGGTIATGIMLLCYAMIVHRRELAGLARRELGEGSSWFEWMLPFTIVLFGIVVFVGIIIKSR